MRPSELSEKNDAAPRRWAPLPEQEALSVLAIVRSLQVAPKADPGCLSGRHVGLLCAQAAGKDGRLLQLAVAELGGRVTYVRLERAEAATPARLLELARFLGRLYDAIECQQMDEHEVRSLAEGMSVPVFDGIATPRHPTARLARRVEGAATDFEKRLLVLKAALLQTLA